MASLRNTLPGITMRSGGSRFSISRTCTELVWVRSRRSGSRWIKNVSCMSRAGCSSGKFSPENTCQSSSISGPSATVKAHAVKNREDFTPHDANGVVRAQRHLAAWTGMVGSAGLGVFLGRQAGLWLGQSAPARLA